MSSIDIDVLYDSFCSRLPSTLRDEARGLATRLGLAPHAEIPWSSVFAHEVTLRAPALLAEGLPGVTARALESAVLAHMLSIIEAFGSDRVADGQARDTAELGQVLTLLREARNDALEDLGGAASRLLAETADRRTHDAIAIERDLLVRGAPIALEEYVEISSGKQAVGIPASVSLAMAAGAGDAKREIEAALMGVWLGLQFQDDVVDWEDDMAHGGAWAVLMARGIAPDADVSDMAAVRRLVSGSGIQVRMLELSREHYHRACAAAASLGATQLALWASNREKEAYEQCESERRSPGYFVRMKKLAAWRSEVLT